MSSKKTAKESERITEYSEKDAVPEDIFKIETAKQPEFYKIPRRFGSIPIDELPLGCDRDEQYYKVYPRIALPFQKADRVSFGHPELEPNRLFWGDNLHVMRMLPSNSIDLIYIDPPFFSGRQYNVIFGDQNEIRSFNDIWEGGMPGYLIWLNARLLEMKRLLKPEGSIYVHLDSHAVHYVKVELDDIFGFENFYDEIIWKRTSAHSNSKSFGNVHDTILHYTKSDKLIWNPLYQEYERKYLDSHYRRKDPDGRIFRTDNLIAPDQKGYRYEWKGVTRNWRLPKERMKELDIEGKIVYTKMGTAEYKRYLDEMPGTPMQDIWIDIPPINSQAKERLGYPTQKPEQLIERIIKASSNEGDVVADFFCGGGTTAAAAQKLNRRWIACDQSRVAIAITQSRIESLFENSKNIQSSLDPVADISLEYWGTYEITSLVTLTETEFRNFIVSAYGGRISTVGDYIHGYKREIPLFVGSASQEKQVTKEDVINFAKEIKTKKGKSQGTMLAWAFSPSAKNAVEKLMAEGNPEIDLIQISPIEIESTQFREHVTKLHDEYESFLKFILPPEVRFSSRRIAPLRYVFDVSESVALNTGAKIINVQWDFDFKGRFTPTKEFAFGRDGKGNPLYKVEFKFERMGKQTIACRIQDDLGGEKIYPQIISVQ